MLDSKVYVGLCQIPMLIFGSKDEKKTYHLCLTDGQPSGLRLWFLFINSTTIEQIKSVMSTFSQAK